ncbi:KP4 killer toxin [Cladobotryum mycophilum]|uniref:KP4 killer toxin n=1 Tax=Cladobotryum mycophilum TaxID=491253 RepID=A0ABR0SQ02_9HYPO
MVSSLAVISTLVASAAALGINCRGSGACVLVGASLDNVLVQVQQIQAMGQGNRWYPAGVQLACSEGDKGTICAFFQSTSGGTANQAAQLIQGLKDHGCGVCGSNPTNPGNDVSHGQLTVNVVSSPCCKGNCHCPF